MLANYLAHLIVFHLISLIKFDEEHDCTNRYSSLFKLLHSSDTPLHKNHSKINNFLFLIKQIELSNTHNSAQKSKNSFIYISITWPSDRQLQVKSLEQTVHNSEQQVTSVNLRQCHTFIQFHTSLVFCSHNLQLLLQKLTTHWHFHNSANHKHLQ
jgi:hypothetical protein